jgi:hypothetical protein
MEVHHARLVVDAEHSGESVAERDDGGVEDAVRAWNLVARDDRVARRPRRISTPTDLLALVTATSIAASTAKRLLG